MPLLHPLLSAAAAAVLATAPAALAEGAPKAEAAAKAAPAPKAEAAARKAETERAVIRQTAAEAPPAVSLEAGTQVVGGGTARAQGSTARPGRVRPAGGSGVVVPSPEAVNAVWDFWFRGQGGGVVLADARLCLEVARDGADRFACAREVDAAGVPAQTNVYAWQAYLVPQGDQVEDITVQLYLGDTLRETKDVQVKGDGIRARNWTALRFAKPGAWRVVIRRGDTVLRTLPVKVL
jgi:nucleoid-associated protein YgaU